MNTTVFNITEKSDKMEQQQYCLKWSNYSSNLATAFSNLFNSETLTDVTLFCEGKSIVNYFISKK